ncbi:TraR/DksA family transcriptional regulator [Desulfonatronum sp. SC1]|uniref:TraR/DksA family transcriptional regulator n=1 Tax=Desulfonatronum sp. SC1 TaxID=2109626 RepID=UPI000D307182|nr:TraR/DksA family transcriptional regulator [Desulfonatronum sp. SC1]PTN33477.1 conjugal transfer protein TraR [Desulfonatronum sp. SC1]
MDHASRKVLEARMREEMAGLREQLGDLEERARTVELDQQAVGRLSRMDSLANQSIAVNALGKAKSRLARLERALFRIEDEDFGLCADCGDPIAPARLLAMPEAVLCVGCAE